MTPTNQMSYDVVILFCPGIPVLTSSGKIHFQVIEENKSSPGTTLYLGGPTRMKAAVELCRQKRVKTFFVVGGSFEKVDLMKTYLEHNNILSDDIIRIESNSDTNGNLHAIKKALKNYKKYAKFKEKSIGALSNAYHMKRIMRFAKDILKGIKLHSISAEDIYLKESNPKRLYEQEFIRREFSEDNGIKEWGQEKYRDQFRPEEEWKARCHDPNLLYKLWQE